MTEKQKKILNKTLNNIIYPLIALAIVLGMWAIASAVKNNPLVLPMPNVVLHRLFCLYKERNFFKSILFTLHRTFLAFIVSFAFAYFFAILSDKFQIATKIIYPIVAILRAAPTVAVILVLYAFLSTKTMSLVVGFLIAFPVLFSNIQSALKNKDENLLKMSKVYKVNPVRVLFNVYFLSIGKYIFDSTQSTLSLTLKVIIAAEILTNVTPSVGGKIQVSYASFEIEYLLAWTIMAILLSFVVELFVAVLKKICIRWK